MGQRKSQWYGILSNLVKIYHDEIDNRQVVGEVIKVLEEEISPVDFYVYGEISSLLGIPIKNLENTDILDVRREILIRGKIEEFDGRTYFPVEGTHGLYGLVEIKKHLGREEREFVEVLVKIMGSGLDKLYVSGSMEEVVGVFQKMNRIYLEMSEINSIEELVDYIKKSIGDLLKVDEVILVWNGRLNKEIEFESYGKRKTDYELMNEWKNRVGKKRESVIVNHLKDWMGKEIGYGSGIGSPIMKDNRIVGYCLLLSKKENHFRMEDVRIINSIIHYASMVMDNVSLMEDLKERVNKDELTKLYNRAYLEEQIEKSLRTDKRGAFLLVDIDDFKKVNDELGHREGDKILRQVADIIRDSIRDGDIAARWGGEELVVYLKGVTKEMSQKIANRLVKKIEKKTVPRVTVSCGVAYWEGEEIQYKDLFLVADQMMYEAKSKGKNQARIGEVLGEQIENGSEEIK